ncbi:MAG: OmpH family outer membrane protein [Kiritimatiellae bacterium]|nr:OmpH family outer membrane protein [Kiritimatiellia bacterium]
MIFKKIFAFSLVIAAAVTMAAEAQKIAVVNMEAVVRSHPKAEQNDKVLRAKQAELEGKRDALLAELKAKEEKIVQLEKDIRTNPMYTEKVKREKAEEGRALVQDLQKSEKEIRAKVAAMQRELSKEERALFDAVMNDIQAAVKKISNEKGISIALDSSAYRASVPMPIVVYSETSIDITDLVITAIGGTRKAVVEE